MEEVCEVAFASFKPLEAVFVEFAVGGVWLELLAVLLEVLLDEGTEDADKLLGS